MPRTAAVFFDVDFTLIHPGERFQGVGYARTCAAHGVAIDAARFDAAVAGAAAVLDSTDPLFDPQLFIDYTRRIIELMGGAGPAVERAAREIYDEWAANQHFTLYDDVAETLEALAMRGLCLGLISNGHRELDAFQRHFALQGWIQVAVSSRDHGYMKPHPSIFRAALEQARVAPEAAVMVGDSLLHDVRGAIDTGMRAVWLDRNGIATDDIGVPVVRRLTELVEIL